MSNKTKLFFVKSIHTVIYLVMVAAIFYILYAGVTETYNIYLYISLVLIILEGVVFYGNGKRCPFTDLAQKYGDEKGYVGDVFMPKKVADNTFNVFGLILLLGIIILISNYFW